MIERDCALAAYEQRPLHIMHLSARESVAARPGRAGARRRRQRGGLAAPPLPHRRRRAHPRHQRKMNPPLRSEDDRAGAARGAPRRHDRLHRDRSRAARAPREGRAVRGGALRRHGARDGVRGALHAPRRAGRARRSRLVLERMSAGPARDLRAAGAADRGGGAARTSSCSTSTPTWTVTEDGFRSQSVNSWLLGETLTGTVVKTIADGRVVHAA